MLLGNISIYICMLPMLSLCKKSLTVMTVFFIVLKPRSATSPPSLLNEEDSRYDAEIVIPFPQRHAFSENTI